MKNRMCRAHLVKMPAWASNNSCTKSASPVSNFKRSSKLRTDRREDFVDETGEGARQLIAFRFSNLAVVA